MQPLVVLGGFAEMTDVVISLGRTVPITLEYHFRLEEL